MIYTFLLWAAFTLILFSTGGVVQALSPPLEAVTIQLTAEERAWLAAHPDITLGSPIIPPWNFVDEKTGQYKGIVPEYLDLIGSKLGITLKNIADDFGKIHQMAREKKIDGIGVAGKTAERAEFLNFAKPYITLQYSIVTPKESAVVATFADLAHKRTGILENSAAYAYLKKNYSDVELMTFKAYDQGILAVLNGEIDAWVGSLAGVVYTISEKGLFGLKMAVVPFEMSRKMGIGVRKDWPELITILNKAIASIDQKEHSRIRSKWLDYAPEGREEKQITLTPTERTWLQAHPDIELGYIDSFAPMLIANDDGTFSGICVDVLKMMNKRLGTNIGLRIDSVPKILKKAQKKEIDGLLSLHPSHAAKLGLLATVGYINAYPTVFARKEIAFAGPSAFAGKKVAIIDKVYFSEEIIRQYGGRANIFRVKDALEGLQGVQKGAFDFYIGLSSNNYMLHKYRLAGLASIYTFFHYTAKFGYAVRPDWPELVSILNKGLASFSEQEIAAIVKQWMEIPEQAKKIELTADEQVWLDAHPVITLGGGIFPPLDDYNKAKGRPEGIGPDYTDLIGDLLGIKFKYISGDWANILKMAKEKEIDGIRIMLRNKEREAYLNFTQSQTAVQYAIFVQKQSDRLHTLKELSQKRVGVMGDTYSHSYLREHYPDIEVVPFKSIEDALFALIGDDLDAIVASLTVAGIAADRLFITSLKVAATVPEMDTRLQIGVRKDWPQLVTILNKAINAITPEQHREIKRKWITFDSEGLTESLRLSQKEKNWLAQNHTVRARIGNLPPYIIFKEDEITGIVIDYLNLIGQRSGVRFEFVSETRPWQEALKSLMDLQGPDLMTSLSPMAEREPYMDFSKPYTVSSRVIFTRTDAEFISSIDDLSGKTLAVPYGTLVHKRIEKGYPDIGLRLYDTDLKSIEAVSTGRADAYIGNLINTSYEIMLKGFTNLKVVAPTPFGDDVYTFGIRRDWPELSSIINKALDTITPAERMAILKRYLSIKYEHGISSKDVLKWGLGFGGGVFLIILLFVFWNKTLRKQVNVRTAELSSSHKLLESEIEERKQKEQQLEEYQQRLKDLASQLTITEEKERRHIAADLHDLIGHSLALARMQLNGILEAQSELERNMLVKDISHILLKSLQDTRSLIFELSSPSLNEIGLGAAVSEWLEEHVGKRHGLKTEFIDEIDEKLRKTLDDNMRAVLFRNVRELLTNVIKHAKAEKVSVHLKAGDGMVSVIVEDDGIGFDPQAPTPLGEKKGGYGLFSIRERMADLRGTFDIQSEPGKGCRAVLTVPVGTNKE